MTDTAALRRAVQHCRDNPDKWEQEAFYYNGRGCVLGWAGYFLPEFFESSEGDLARVDNNSWVTGREVATALNLDEEDFQYIYSHVRTLNEIEDRIDEIEDREHLQPVEFINIRIRDRVLNIPASALNHVIAAARAVDPEVEITKLLEEKL